MDASTARSLWWMRRLLIGMTALVLLLTAIDDLRGPTSSDVAAAAAPATTPPPGSAPLTPRSVTIAATGELLPHPSVVEHAARAGARSGRAYDFGALFSDIAPTVASADLAICHLEVPVAPPGRPLSGYPAFGIPAEIAEGIRDTGWDRCSTASNHVNDRGTAGIVATLDALDAAAVAHSGTARSAEEAAAVPLSFAAGVPVAHLSYTWGFNGTPPAEPWMSNVIQPDVVLADAAAVRAGGAELVVVSLHWGNEFDTIGTDDQRSLAARLLASPDIDLLVGHGPHVLQPIERVGDEYALLSVGNLIANQGLVDHPDTYDGVVVTVRFTQRSDGRFGADPPVVRPTWYDRDAGRVRLVSAALADPALASIHDPLAASLARTRSVLDPFVTVD